MSGSTDASFRERTVLLAGATGELGAVVAQKLLSSGARLAIAVRRPWQVEAIKTRFGRGVLVGVVPATDAEAAAGFVKGLQDALGPLDALIVTLGAFAVAEVGKDRSDLAAQLVEANYLAPATLARAVVPPMRRRKSGAIVLTGARAVGSALPGMAQYLASKAALHAFGSCLHSELAPLGIHVAIVAPPALDTVVNRKVPVNAPLMALDRVADALLLGALGRLPGPPPLYPLDIQG